jgi:TatD DNase family protein
MLIDSHCHLEFDKLAADRDGILTRMAENGVDGCVTISTRIKRFDEVKAIAEAHDNIWCSVGTHPHHADEEMDITTDEIVRLSEHPKCVAIGEVGLDYHYDFSARDNQAEGFRRHIAASRITGLPLVIHAREADDDVADILEEETGKGAFPFLLHCFSSGPELARRGLALGGYLSFSGILTFKNALDIQKVATEAPVDRILVETDSPYLAPIPYRGKTNEPGYVRHTAEKLAELRGVNLEEIALTTTRNFAKLFSKTGLTA